MDLNRKMLSDLILMIGIILGVIGWGGRDVGGIESVVSYLLLLLGIGFGIWGIYRYIQGHKKRPTDDD